MFKLLSSVLVSMVIWILVLISHADSTTGGMLMFPLLSTNPNPNAERILSKLWDTNNVDSDLNGDDNSDARDMVVFDLLGFKVGNDEDLQKPPKSSSSSRLLHRVKRIKRDESESPAAAPAEKKPTDPSSAAAAAYPTETTPNTTCMTMDDLNRHGMSLQGRPYGKSFGKKCPKKFPCKEFGACRIWRTGVVDKRLKLDLKTAEAYYTDLFIWVHKTKLDLILKAFEECVKEYKLEEEFKDPGTKSNNNTKDGAGKKSKKKREVGDQEKSADGGGSGTNTNTLDGGSDTSKKTAGAGAAETDPSSDRSILCMEKIEDYFECFDRAAIMGTCYWPDTSSSEKRI